MEKDRRTDAAFCGEAIGAARGDVLRVQPERLHHIFAVWQLEKNRGDWAFGEEEESWTSVAVVGVNGPAATDRRDNRAAGSHRISPPLPPSSSSPPYAARPPSSRGAPWLLLQIYHDQAIDHRAATLPPTLPRSVGHQSGGSTARL